GGVALGFVFVSGQHAGYHRGGRRLHQLMADSVEALFAARVASDPTRPIVTFYDDATGERTELSSKSLANWVAKTHFLVLDELGARVGDRAFVSLPVHWL